MTIEERLKRIEKANRRLRISLGACVAAIAIATIAGVGTQPASHAAVTAELRTRQLVVVDRDGRPVILIASNDSQGDPVIAEAERLRFQLWKGDMERKVAAAQQRVAQLPVGSEARLEAAAEYQSLRDRIDLTLALRDPANPSPGGTIRFLGDGGSESARLGAANDTSFLDLFDRREGLVQAHPRMSLTADGGRGSLMTYTDEGDITAAILGSVELGESVLWPLPGDDPTPIPAVR
jgi:hypothetical protein